MNSELKKDMVKEVAETPASDRVYITIPLVTLYDQPHPGVQLIGGAVKVKDRDGKWIEKSAGTNLKFEAGKTYECTPAVAAEVQDRLERFNREEIRLLRPKTDQKSLNQVNAGSLWAKGAAVSLENGLESIAGPSERVIVTKW